jgi:hypothetical protein
MLRLCNIHRDHPRRRLSSVFSRFQQIISAIHHAALSALQLPIRDFSFQQCTGCLVPLTRRLVTNSQAPGERSTGHR